jgi:hypothetical protein
MSMCAIGIRFPNAAKDDRYSFRYTIKTDKDHLDALHNCGKTGYPACPEQEQPWGDQDCGLVAKATELMTADEANESFCTNAIGHTVFERDAPHVWTELQPLTKWENNKYNCDWWLLDRGRKVLETVSYHTLDDAEKCIVHLPPPPERAPPHDLSSFMGDSFIDSLIQRHTHDNSTVGDDDLPVELPQRVELTAAEGGGL